MMIKAFLVLTAVLISSYAGVAIANDILRVHVESVYDGDTFTISERLIPDIDLKWHVRIRGIDAPELRSACEYERVHAVAARDALTAMLEDSGSQVILSDITHDKYGGRLVATVTLLDGTRVSDALISSALVRMYSGGSKRTWCPS